MKVHENFVLFICWFAQNLVGAPAKLPPLSIKRPGEGSKNLISTPGSYFVFTVITLSCAGDDFDLKFYFNFARFFWYSTETKLKCNESDMETIIDLIYKESETFQIK